MERNLEEISVKVTFKELQFCTQDGGKRVMPVLDIQW